MIRTSYIEFAVTCACGRDDDITYHHSEPLEIPEIIDAALEVNGWQSEKCPDCHKEHARQEHADAQRQVAGVMDIVERRFLR